MVLSSYKFYWAFFDHKGKNYWIPLLLRKCVSAYMILLVRKFYPCWPKIASLDHWIILLIEIFVEKIIFSKEENA